MKTEKTEEGYWLTTGQGPVRKIATEGDTRKESVERWVDVYNKQREEIQTDIDLDAKPEIDITIDTSEDLDTIILTFVAKGKKMAVGFSLPEAQMLNIWLNEAVTKVMLEKLNIPEPTSQTKH